MGGGTALSKSLLAKLNRRSNDGCRDATSQSGRYYLAKGGGPDTHERYKITTNIYDGQGPKEIRNDICRAQIHSPGKWGMRIGIGV